MTEPSGRSVVERFARAQENKDFDELEKLITDDFIDEMPQSGERIRGKANELAILRNYPRYASRDRATSTHTWVPPGTRTAKLGR